MEKNFSSACDNFTDSEYPDPRSPKVRSQTLFWNICVLHTKVEQKWRTIHQRDKRNKENGNDTLVICYPCYLKLVTGKGLGGTGYFSSNIFQILIPQANFLAYYLRLRINKFNGVFPACRLHATSPFFSSITSIKMSLITIVWEIHLHHLKRCATYIIFKRERFIAYLALALSRQLWLRAIMWKLQLAMSTKYFWSSNNNIIVSEEEGTNVYDGIKLVSL